jgi:hypothetical protein
MSMTGGGRPNQDAPGHASGEIARLIDQGRWFADLTQRFFRGTGMQPGMRVLDIGCGAGSRDEGALESPDTEGRLRQPCVRGILVEATSRSTATSSPVTVEAFSRRRA